MNNFIKIYVFNKKQNSSLFLLSTLSIALILLRVKTTQTIYLMFLIWNLFLAIIPYLISFNLKSDIVTKKINLKFYIKLLIWMLFLPNSFYLITDFIHLHHITTIQYLYDGILLSCFTLAGFYSGILAVNKIHQAISRIFDSKKTEYFILIISYLSAFGVYLGRSLRFNSWDIISNPLQLFESIITSLFQIEAIVFTLFLGTFILSVHKALSYLKLLNKSS